MIGRFERLKGFFLEFYISVFAFLEMISNEELIQQFKVVLRNKWFKRFVVFASRALLSSIIFRMHRRRLRSYGICLTSPLSAELSYIDTLMCICGDFLDNFSPRSTCHMLRAINLETTIKWRLSKCHFNCQIKCNVLRWWYVSENN